MGKGIQGAVLRALGAKEHSVVVTGRTHLAEHFIRIAFRSDTLLGDGPLHPDSWIRLWFPNPDDPSTLHQRGYTLVDPDPESGTFAIDFVLHHPMGPASYWAGGCEVGERLVAQRFGAQPFTLLDPPPAGYLLLGDLASYPAITSIAAAVPDDVPVAVYMERHSPLDETLPLPGGRLVTAAWVDELPDGQGLAQAIDGRDWTGWFAWIGAESLATRRARSLLTRDHGLNKATLHAQAYWMRGRALGKSRTLAELNELNELNAAREAAEPAVRAEKPERAPSGGPGRTGPAAPAPPLAASAVEPEAPVPVLAPAKRVLWAACITQVLLSVLQVIPFILLADVARLLLAGAPPGRFLRTAVTAGVVMGLAATGTAVLLTALHVYDASYSAALRRRLMDKLTRLPLGWFASRGSEEVKRIVGDDVNALHYVVTHAVTECVGAAATPLLVLVYLFGVQWRLALVLLLPILAFVVVMSRIMKRDADDVARSQRCTARVSAQAQTFISSREEARVLGTSSVVDLPGTLTETGDFIAEWQMRTGPAKIVAVMLNRPTTVLGLLLAAAYPMMILGWTDAPELVPFLVLGTSFGGRLLGVSTSIGALTSGLQARDALETFLATPELALPTADGGPEGAGPPPAPAPDRLALEGVTFAYDAGHPVLTDLSLSLEPGVVTALVGPSGAGKSTVAALAARLWDPQGGRVALGGTDLRELAQDDLYARVTILLQDVQLIRATVRDNIALTRPEATRAQIEEAARAARVHDVIAALPQGYDTVVDSSRLSGGERQRLGIARALLADTPVVILDEATASADPDSELEIRRALSTLLKGRTVLMIAHRLHTVRDAERIVVMDHGRVVETGTHASLMAADGVYAAMWAATGSPETSADGGERREVAIW